jgi:hypothetical protein
MSQEKCNTVTHHFKCQLGNREVLGAVTTELRSYGRMHWAVDALLTEKEARALQLKKGYHPQGHGFFRFKYPTNSTTTWTCSACCD